MDNADSELVSFEVFSKKIVLVEEIMSMILKIIWMEILLNDFSSLYPKKSIRRNFFRKYSVPSPYLRGSRE